MKQKNLFFKKIISTQFLFIICLTFIINILLIPKEELAASYVQTIKTGVDNFPEEYKSAIQNLQSIYPNASFQCYYTGISWDELIQSEKSVHMRNTVVNSSPNSWKCDCGKVAGGYACASEDIIKYYIDPKNFLDEVGVFQFLEISYNENIHNIEGVKRAVENTFLNNNVTYTKDGQTKTCSYAEIILEAAKQSGMSPYSIVTKIIQEVGTKGSSSVSGTYSGYEGYYNFYNYGAYDTGNAIVNALRYAKDSGWDNQYDAIIDGAKLIANSYTNAGQNTAYFYKWDVVGNSILKEGETRTINSGSCFAHQYMTNIRDPETQSKRLYNTYAENNLLDGKLNFIIPVYGNSSSNKLPTEIDVQNNDCYYVNDEDGVKLRDNPSLSGNRIAGLAKDTIVIMLERKKQEADGYSWDKVQLENGVVGYVASEFLTSCKGEESSNSQNNDTVIGKYITTDNLRLRSEASTSGVKIATIPSQTIIEVIQKDVANDGENVWYKIKYNGTIGYVSASYLTQTNNSQESSTKGDVNGDGQINSADALKILKHSVDLEKIEDCYLSGADVNGDGQINSADALKILRYSVGLESL